jgi:hypothetical protein
LAEGPSQLPDRAIEGIVRQLDQTNQRRPRWLPGREPMNRMILAVGGVAAAIALTFIAFGMYLGLNTGAPGVGGAPSPTPTVAPTAVPTEPDVVLYTSERHGYSLLLPDDSWKVVEKFGTWPLGQTFNEDGPGVDNVLRKDAASEAWILINSQPVPSGTSLERWAVDYDSALRANWPECEVERSESAVLDGETARLYTYLCGTISTNDALALHGGRAYAIRVFNTSDPKLDARPIIDEWISRFRFTD